MVIIEYLKRQSEYPLSKEATELFSRRGGLLDM